MVVRRRLLVTVLRVCVEAVILCGGLILALVLSARIATAAIMFLVFLVRTRGFGLSTVSYFAHLPTAIRLTVVTELSGVTI